VLRIGPDALTPGGDGRIAESVLGTTDSSAVADDLISLCRASLQRTPVECSWVHLSIGATFGLVLDDGTTVVVKAHGPRKSQPYLEAMRRVQLALANVDFPTPRPLAGPVPFRLGFAVIDEHLDGDAITDAKFPDCRTPMAATLAKLVASASNVEGCEGLAERRWPQPRTQLWPTPHNVLFDFEATAAGAEWIDALAETAHRTVSTTATGRAVVGHGDWSANNLRMRHGHVCAVYDWDSLVFDHESSVVGGAAAHFPFDDLREDWVPTPAEARAFVDDYQTARDTTFSAAERRAVGAATLYGLAYTARCEHAIRMSEGARSGALIALVTYGDDYLAI
jgi:hypothetical protein